MRPRAAVARLRADLRQGTAPRGPRSRGAAACCSSVHIPVTLESPGRGSRAGTDRPYPPRRGCYSGRRAQGQGMCENRGGPAMVPGVRDAASFPPMPRSRPREGPLSRPVPLSPLTLPQGHPTEEARSPGLQSWGSHSRSRQPPEQGPNALGEAQLQRPGVGGGEPPSSPARSIPGHCCHQRTCPTLPSSSLPGRGRRAAALEPDPVRKIALPRGSGPPP